MNEYYRDLEKINNVLFCLLAISTMMLLALLVILLGSLEEIENGCITYNDGIYCEVKTNDNNWYWK